MKNYHAILITLIAGVMLGCAVPAKADRLDGRYVCGNTGVNIEIATDPAVEVSNGVSTHNVDFVVTGENGKVLWYGGAAEFGEPATEYEIKNFGSSYFARVPTLSSYTVHILDGKQIKAQMFVRPDPNVWEWVATEREYICTKK